MIITASAADGRPARSPFSGTDICAQAGFQLPPGAIRPMFEHDTWDLAAVAGLPVQLPAYARRLDFSAVTVPHWRLVAKELVFALLVPRHPAVVVLPGVLRTALHLTSCAERLAELTR